VEYPFSARMTPNKACMTNKNGNDDERGRGRSDIGGRKEVAS